MDVMKSGDQEQSGQDQINIVELSAGILRANLLQSKTMVNPIPNSMRSRTRQRVGLDWSKTAQCFDERMVRAKSESDSYSRRSRYVRQLDSEYPAANIGA